MFKPFGFLDAQTPVSRQRGGTIVGVIVGLVIGLGVALAVAIYVTKAPINFAHKTQTRSPEQDAQEAKKNKDWDPNTPLYGKNPVKPASVAESATTTTVAPPTSAPVATTTTAPTAKPAATAKSADPLGDLAKSKSSAATGADPFVYFVQGGAFRSAPEAEAQRAKLAMFGFDAKVTEREQSGYTVYRVRVGPLDKKEDADKTKEKLESSGVEAVLVRVNR